MKPENNLRAAMDRRLSALHGTDQHVRHVLRVAKGEQPVKAKKRISAALIFAIIALVGVAVAATISPTIDWVNEMFGNKSAEVLTRGDVMDISQNRTVGEVQYRWVDTVLAKPFEEAEAEEDAAPPPGANVISLEGTQVLYGTVEITPVEGANVVLIPEDYRISDPAGYNLFLGEQAPEDAPSFLDMAVQKDAKILLAKAVPHGILLDGKLHEGYEVGYDYRTNKDGSITYHYMIYGVPEELTEYSIQMFVSNWEITREGQWLRGEKDEQGNDTKNTWLKEEWVVTVKPESKK